MCRWYVGRRVSGIGFFTITKPTADDDLNFSYLYFRENQGLTVNYNLNGKNNLNVFIVFRILEVPGAALNGIFGNDNGGNDRYVRHDRTPKELRIGHGKVT